MASVVWIIDVDQWPRAMLRAELIERGYDAVGYVTVRKCGCFSHSAPFGSVSHHQDSHRS